jgi:hypothetical protein
MIDVLLLGLLIGMRHALEADHVAAVASLATRARRPGETLRMGIAWGVGHTLTLFLFGAVVLILQTAVPERLAQGLEFAVGVMLVLLGADVLRRVIQARLHFHLHQHPGGIRHFHAHAHAGPSEHHPAHHAHDHPSGFPLRALLVGLVHGMAGSAALVLLTVETIASVPLALAYIAVFGLGSIAGMALLSAVIALPLRLSSRYLTWSYNGLSMGVGLLTLLLGGLVMYRTGGELLI